MAAVTSRENVVCSHVEPVLSFFYQYHKSWFFLISQMLRCSALTRFSVSSLPTSVPTLHTFSTTLIAPLTVIISDPTES